MDRGLWHCTGDRNQDYAQEKEMKKAKWLSEEALQKERKQKAVKRKEAKSKGRKERYTNLNAEFQRISRKEKKDFLSGMQRNRGKQSNRKD